MGFENIKQPTQESTTLIETSSSKVVDLQYVYDTCDTTSVELFKLYSHLSKNGDITQEEFESIQQKMEHNDELKEKIAQRITEQRENIKDGFVQLYESWEKMGINLKDINVIVLEGSGGLMGELFLRKFFKKFLDAEEPMPKILRLPTGSRNLSNNMELYNYFQKNIDQAIHDTSDESNIILTMDYVDSGTTMASILKLIEETDAFKKSKVLHCLDVLGQVNLYKFFDEYRDQGGQHLTKRNPSEIFKKLPEQLENGVHEIMIMPKGIPIESGHQFQNKIFVAEELFGITRELNQDDRIRHFKPSKNLNHSMRKLYENEVDLIIDAVKYELNS